MYSATTLVFAIALVQGCLAAGWSHDDHEDNGPSHWADSYPDCDGERQSPIDIDTMDAEYQSDLYEFDFHGYDSTSGLSLQLINNGHAAQVNIISGDVSITGGNLMEPYKLAQFHFHWGSDDQQGSEHTMNGMAYPMEVHFVHFAEQHGDLGTAADKPNGLAVLGFFFQIGEHNSNFDEIVNNLQNVVAKDSETAINAFTLMSLLPSDLQHYYRYSGSLTTPGCFESVIWTVFNEKITISHEQMEEFRKLMGDGHHVVDNYRPVQAQGIRVVHSSIDDGVPTAGSTAATSTLPALLLTTVAFIAKMFI